MWTALYVSRWCIVAKFQTLISWSKLWSTPGFSEAMTHWTERLISCQKEFDSGYQGKVWSCLILSGLIVFCYFVSILFCCTIVLSWTTARDISLSILFNFFNFFPTLVFRGFKKIIIIITDLYSAFRSEDTVLLYLEWKLNETHASLSNSMQFWRH